MESGKINNAFWPSYVDIMTTLFAIMLILFAVSYSRFKSKERDQENTVSQLQIAVDQLQVTTGKYNELLKMQSIIKNVDERYFDYNEEYIKNIFKLSIQYQRGEFDLHRLEQDRLGHVDEANRLRSELVEAGRVIKNTIEQLQHSDVSKQKIKYLVVIEGQASADGYNVNNYFNNDVLSYQRALALHRFWSSHGINFKAMAHCELVICGSGEGGVPRDTTEEANNQRFLIHIVPVMGTTTQE